MLLLVSADTIDVSFKSYEDNSVRIKTFTLKAALLAISIAAPGQINNYFKNGYDLRPVISRIPILCRFDLSQLTVVPRNAYALVSYSPQFDHQGKEKCDTDAQGDLFDYLMGDSETVSKQFALFKELTQKRNQLAESLFNQMNAASKAEQASKEEL